MDMTTCLDAVWMSELLEELRELREKQKIVDNELKINYGSWKLASPEEMEEHCKIWSACNMSSLEIGMKARSSRR